MAKAKKTQVTWTPLALRRLEEITSYIEREGYPDAAADLAQRLLDGAEQLERFPLSGKVCPEQTTAFQLNIDAYRLIYDSTPTGINILTITGPGQDVSKITW